jgi:hypothetical protein
MSETGMQPRCDSSTRPSALKGEAAVWRTHLAFVLVIRLGHCYEFA